MNIEDAKELIAEKHGPEVARKWAAQQRGTEDASKERVWKCANCHTHTNGNELEVPCRVCGHSGTRYIETPA